MSVCNFFDLRNEIIRMKMIYGLRRHRRTYILVVDFTTLVFVHGRSRIRTTYRFSLYTIARVTVVVVSAQTIDFLFAVHYGPSYGNEATVDGVFEKVPLTEWTRWRVSNIQKGGWRAEGASL